MATSYDGKTKRFQFVVAGSGFRPSNKLAQLAKIVELGELVVLTREPTNPYDSNAIKCFIKGVFVGYVPKSLTSDVSLHAPSSLVRVEVIPSDEFDPIRFEISVGR